MSDDSLCHGRLLKNNHDFYLNLYPLSFNDNIFYQADAKLRLKVSTFEGSLLSENHCFRDLLTTAKFYCYVPEGAASFGNLRHTECKSGRQKTQFYHNVNSMRDLKG